MAGHEGVWWHRTPFKCVAAAPHSRLQHSVVAAPLRDLRPTWCHTSPGVTGTFNFTGFEQDPCLEHRLRWDAGTPPLLGVQLPDAEILGHLVTGQKLLIAAALGIFLGWWAICSKDECSFRVAHACVGAKMIQTLSNLL